MSFLWIRFLRAVHVWTGRRLQRIAVKRLLRELAKHLRDKASKPQWN